MKELKLLNMDGNQALSPELLSLLLEQEEQAGVQSLFIVSPASLSFSHGNLSQLLKMMPNLHQIQFNRLETIEGELDPQQQPAISRNLRTLKMNSSSSEILHHLKGVQLTTLWISIDHNIQGVPEAWRRFLENQKKLQSLGLDISREDQRLHLFNGHIDNNTFPFKLRSFVVRMYHHYRAGNMANLERFIRTQHSTLQKLEIYHENGEVFRAIQDLHNLTTLTLYSMPSPINFRNGHVRELTVNLLELHNIENLQQLLTNHPNLRRLNTDYDFDNRALIESIAETLHELTHLSVKVLNEQLFRDIRFDRLESLTVYNVAAGINWTQFTNHNIGVREVRVEVWDGTRDELHHMLRGFTGLTKLTVENTFIIYDIDFLLAMRTARPNLQEALLNISGFPDGFDLAAAPINLDWVKRVSFTSFDD